MDFFDVIKSRHCYKQNLDPAAPPMEDLKKIVQAGLDAPSGANAQTTGFLLITNPEIVGKINDMPGGNKAMSSAPAYIATHVAKTPENIFKTHNFEIEDCAAAVENMLLAVTALGYGAVWIDGWLRVDDRAGKIGELCGLESDRVIRIILPVGKPIEEEPRREKKGFDERVRVI